MFGGSPEEQQANLTRAMYLQELMGNPQGMGQAMAGSFVGGGIGPFEADVLSKGLAKQLYRRQLRPDALQNAGRSGLDDLSYIISLMGG